MRNSAEVLHHLINKIVHVTHLLILILLRKVVQPLGLVEFVLKLRRFTLLSFFIASSAHLELFVIYLNPGIALSDTLTPLVEILLDLVFITVELSQVFVVACAVEFIDYVIFLVLHFIFHILEVKELVVRLSHGWSPSLLFLSAIRSLSLEVGVSEFQEFCSSLLDILCSAIHPEESRALLLSLANHQLLFA